ncbi:beta-lactamase-like protein [Mycena vitilis]|nr:beta-lactamase-like protein [Mycena vitilis]
MRLLTAFSLVFVVGQSYASSLDFGIPPSNATVQVSVFNVANMSLTGAGSAFFSPTLPGRENGHFVMFSFLIEHKESQKRLMFDLGIRKDPQNLVPNLAAFFTEGVATIEQDRDITELLKDGGIPLTSINAVIWSHSHFDHIGDMSLFPNTTGLIIGSETNTSTYPENADALLQASDLSGRQITKVDFATANLTFSGLKAIDYFGDGSLYLLHTPGHLPGHISALARVTPTTFISLGGDTFHHAGQARPRPQLQTNFPCPAHLLEDIKASVSTDYFWSPRSRDGAFDLPSRAQQLLAISDAPGSFYTDPVTAQVSLEKVATFDADPDFWVIVAHDISLRSSVPYFPACLNNWKATKLKENSLWNFLDGANPAFVFSPTT